ncbi:MAG: M1 family aminopeptidase, partial [Cyclobacteriaceae bacterium]
KWMWMDEGLNTYLHQRTLAERYPTWKSTTPKDIIKYMSGDRSILRPTMTNSDNDILTQMGANFYQKPTVGFQMLRNTIVGKELFDKAFKEYANRWKFKHPNPSDLFRTLEDQTAVDLDWFWKGWYYTTEVVDVDLAQVKWFQIDDPETSVENKNRKGKIVKISGNGKAKSNNDFSSGPEVIQMLPSADSEYRQFLSRVNEAEIREQLKDKHIYELTFQNKGGLVMPVIIYWTYADGSTEREVLPAEIWRHNEAEVRKTFLKSKEVTTIEIDPNQELPDVNLDNNTFPRLENNSRFDQFSEGN